MRTEIVHVGAGELTYEIRNIIGVAEKLQGLGVKVNLENIGDPVAKGEHIPAWFKEIVKDLAAEDETYGYCPTKGVVDVREYLAALNNQEGGVQITSEDILFFNGLGDAIAKLYGFLNRTARVLTPSPTYTSHSSSEAAHAGTAALSYRLNPHNGWYPDIGELRKQVKYNPSVAGILIVNPDNPTGMVFPEALLKEIVAIAKEFDLFIVADEIYRNLIYGGEKTCPLSKVIGDVPGISMKGISKEFPWPGARCGWIEVYNRDKDSHFSAYIQSILNAKMLEVCSTTLPQRAIPRIMAHPEYRAYRQTRLDRYERLSLRAHEVMGQIPGIVVNRPGGAFYLSVVFEEGCLDRGQVLPLANDEVRHLVEELTVRPGTSLDKRFVYYLLAATGICVVPLSSFNTTLMGFRMTLLERDEHEFQRIIATLANAIRAYLASTEGGALDQPLPCLSSWKAA